MMIGRTTRFQLKRAFRRAFSTHYDLLGVSKTANKDEIRKAYLKKAKILHPDMQPAEKQEEATAKFRELLEAYQTLSDANQRERYDLGMEAPSGSEGKTSGSYEEHRRQQSRQQRRPEGEKRDRRYTQEELEEELNRLREEFEREQREFHRQHGGAPEGKFTHRGRQYVKDNMASSGETPLGLGKHFLQCMAGVFIFWLFFKSAGDVKQRRRMQRQHQRYSDEVVKVYHANKELAPSYQMAAKKKAGFQDPSELEDISHAQFAHGTIPAPPKFGDPNNWNK